MACALRRAISAIVFASRASREARMVATGDVGDLGSQVVGDADIDDQRKLGANVLLGEAMQVQPPCAADDEPDQRGGCATSTVVPRRGPS
jgi:hypothetical protein